jgi:hypothetical protein
MNIQTGIRRLAEKGVNLLLTKDGFYAEPKMAITRDMAIWLIANKPAIMNALKMRVDNQQVEPDHQKAEADLLALASEMEADGHAINWQELHKVIANATTKELHIAIVMFNVTYRTDIDKEVIEQGNMTASQWHKITDIELWLDSKGMGYAVPAFNEWQG